MCCSVPNQHDSTVQSRINPDQCCSVPNETQSTVRSPFSFKSTLISPVQYWIKPNQSRSVSNQPDLTFSSESNPINPFDLVQSRINLDQFRINLICAVPSWIDPVQCWFKPISHESNPFSHESTMISTVQSRINLISAIPVLNQTQLSINLVQSSSIPNNLVCAIQSRIKTNEPRSLLLGPPFSSESISKSRSTRPFSPVQSQINAGSVPLLKSWITLISLSMAFWRSTGEYCLYILPQRWHCSVPLQFSTHTITQTKNFWKGFCHFSGSIQKNDKNTFREID